MSLRAIQNIPYTSGETCGCHYAWRHHYRDHSGSKRDTCSHCGVWADLKGAHVRARGGSIEYIVLLCAGCNGWPADEVMYIDARIPLVPTDLRDGRVKRFKPQPEPPMFTTTDVLVLGTCAAVVIGGLTTLIVDAVRTKPPVAQPPQPQP